MPSTSVVIADRHPMVLYGLSSVLAAHQDFNVLACCRDGASCIEALRTLAPDVIILDVSLPGASWLEIISTINSESPGTRPVFFTALEEGGELIKSAAVAGYSIIPKDATPDVLMQSLRQIAEGKRLIPVLSEQAVAREQSAVIEHALTTLTERERQIMQLVSEGLSNKDIGRRLNITDGTIKVHLHHIFQKLEISNRTVLAALALGQNERASVAEDLPTEPTWLD